MIVVNLFGVPGSGKSTGAAYIFSKLKMAGINAELVSEFAKDKVWEETKAVFENQAYIFGKQSFRMSRCKDKVDVIITDSPLPLSIFYNKNKDVYGASFDKSVMDVFNSYQNLNFLINRVKPYNPKGRFQSEEESNALKAPMIDFLKSQNINYVEMDGNLQSYDVIAMNIVQRLVLLHQNDARLKEFNEALETIRIISSGATGIILDEHRRISAENKILNMEIEKLKSANKALTEELSKLKEKKEDFSNFEKIFVAHVTNVVKDAENRRESKIRANGCRGRGRYCAHDIGNVCPFNKPCSEIEDKDWLEYLKKIS